MKLGLRQVDEAAANLLKLRDRVDTDVAGQPLALGAIVGTEFGYIRSDGVTACAGGVLRPRAGREIPSIGWIGSRSSHIRMEGLVRGA